MTRRRQNTGSFVQTTQVWDVAQLYDVNVNSREFKDLLVQLYQQINNIATVLNTKKTAYYLDDEFNNGSQWCNPNSNQPQDLRPGFTKVVVFGTVNAGANTQAHGLDYTANRVLTFTSISGAANETTTPQAYALPNSNITVSVTTTDVVINNASGVTFDNAYVVLEYLEY